MFIREAALRLLTVGDAASVRLVLLNDVGSVSHVSIGFEVEKCQYRLAAASVSRRKNHAGSLQEVY